MDGDKKGAYSEHAEDPKHTVNVNNFAQNVNAKSVHCQALISQFHTNSPSGSLTHSLDTPKQHYLRKSHHSAKPTI